MATRVKSTKQYKQLLAALGDDDRAMAAYRALNPEPEAADPRIAELLAAGFTQEQAEKALAVAETAPEPEPEAKPALTRKQEAEALVAQQGLTFTKGRVYVTPDIIEAAVRCLKSGTTSVIQSSGVGRTKAVLIFREDTGDVSIQNLTRPV